MKKRLTAIATGALILTGMVFPVSGFGQSPKALANKYMKKLPSGKPTNDGKLRKYRMTAIYMNRDLYGKFTGKTKVTGDYTRGYSDSSVTWKNVFISGSDSFSEPFPAGTKQEYMENMRYIPSYKMLDKSAFKDFPTKPENVFARNLIWDMLTFDTYAWNFSDSLKLNQSYLVPGMHFKFDMAEIGKYEHNDVILCWKGISVINGELCAVIDFNAIDNILELNMPMINSKGTEQYWGTVWVSIKTGNIEQGLMYGGTIQEIEVKGMKDKFLTKTIRELYLDKIQ